MFRKIALTAASVLALGAPVFAETAESHVEDVAFAHEGPFGKFDQFQLQRGLQVYTEVCSACHGLKYVPIRSLTEGGGPGLPEDQVRAYAAQLAVLDERSNPKLFDATKEAYIVTYNSNFPAHNANDPVAPDLSLMAKARAGFHGPYGTGMSQLFNGMGGPEYIYSILTGYTGEEKEEFGSFFYENKAFPGGWIAMGPPLSDDQVTYADGHPATVHHMAEDVASFLMWAAEPNLMARKNAGFVGVIFLIILSTLLYLTNKQLWAGIKGRKHA
jgi:ubiquinol-cytochrome c reductase cytochrome c1 subunit